MFLLEWPVYWEKMVFGSEGDFNEFSGLLFEKKLLARRSIIVSARKTCLIVSKNAAEETLAF